MSLVPRNFLTLLKQVFARSGSPAAPKACFVYYMRFKNSAMLYREAKALSDEGYAVDVICLRDRAEDPVCTVFRGLRLFRIQARPAVERKAWRYFLRLGFFFVKTAMLLSVLALRRQYRVVHVTSPPDPIVFTALVPKLLGATVLLDIHDIGPELFMRKLGVSEERRVIRILKSLERASARFADHVITVTELWRQRLASRSTRASRVTVLLNVPDEAVFRPATRPERPSTGVCNLFYHGSLEEHFGVDTVLDALPAILRACPQVRVHIYGSGRLRGLFEQRVEDDGLTDAVRFYGKIPFYELPQALAGADIGLVPTKDEVFSEEALSMKSLEYITLGIPIVISATRAHRYYYDDSQVTFFEPRNRADLTRAVVQLVRDPVERRRKADQAFHFVRDNGWRELKQTYLRLVDGRR